VLDAHFPTVHRSVVQELPSLHCVSVQHSKHAVPQSSGVWGEQAQVAAVQTAPGLQAPAHDPQCLASDLVSTSQSSGIESQSANPIAQAGFPATHC
jgi:hypothetical protein